MEKEWLPAAGARASKGTHTAHISRRGRGVVVVKAMHRILQSGRASFCISGPVADDGLSGCPPLITPLRERMLSHSMHMLADRRKGTFNPFLLHKRIQTPYKHHLYRMLIWPNSHTKKSMRRSTKGRTPLSIRRRVRKVPWLSREVCLSLLPSLFLPTSNNMPNWERGEKIGTAPRVCL